MSGEREIVTHNVVDLGSKHFSRGVIRAAFVVATAMILILRLPDRAEYAQYTVIGMVVFGASLLYALQMGRIKIGFDCPTCGKRLSTNVNWVCGYCDHTNIPGSFFEIASLVDGCGKAICRKKPKSYICDHCNHIIFLDKDHDDKHPAIATGKPRPVTIGLAPTLSPEELRQQETRKRHEAAERVVSDLKVAEAAALKEKEAKEIGERIRILTGEHEPDSSDPLITNLKNATQRMSALVQFRKEKLEEIETMPLPDQDKRYLKEAVYRLVQNALDKFKNQ